MPEKKHVAFYVEPEIWLAFRELTEKLGYSSTALVMREWIYEELLLHGIDPQFPDETKLSDHYDLRTASETSAG